MSSLLDGGYAEPMNCDDYDDFVHRQAMENSHVIKDTAGRIRVLLGRKIFEKQIREEAEVFKSWLNGVSASDLKAEDGEYLLPIPEIHEDFMKVLIGAPYKDRCMNCSTNSPKSVCIRVSFDNENGYQAVLSTLDGTFSMLSSYQTPWYEEAYGVDLNVVSEIVENLEKY